MQIKSILSRLSNPAKLAGHQEAAEPTSRQSLEAAGLGSHPSTASLSRLHEILARYDVTDISPQAFSEMLEKLRQAGLLSPNDLQELGQIRIDLKREGIRPDERINLVQWYAKRLKAIQEQSEELEQKLGPSGLQALEASIRCRLEWLEKFLAIHRAPDAAMVNTLA